MQKLYRTIRLQWNTNPLAVIMITAFIPRLIAVIFAKGWGMLDDHFLVIEVAQSWLDGGNKSHWLPWSSTNTGPTGHSFFYAGLHYFFFMFLEWIGIFNPQTKMFFARLVHAALSMVTVYLGYRIAENFSGRNAARITGLLLATTWFMPWISVRNLVEVASIPFLITGTWMLIRRKSDSMIWYPIVAGLIVGVAFSIRYQTLIYAGGMGLALLFNKRIKTAVLFGTGYITSVILLQGVVDLIIWGSPFAEFIRYVSYNLQYRYDYITGPWYHYIMILLLLLIPPVSIFIFAGMFKNWKRKLIVFLPTLLFLVFHSYFPNKQERFILTIVPFLFIIGISGWIEVREASQFLHRRRKWIHGSWIFFWIINLILLTGVSTMYSKRARAEAMTYLYRYKDIKSIMLENSNGRGVQIIPQFYLGQWVRISEFDAETTPEELKEITGDAETSPRFVLFYRDQNLQQRVEHLKVFLPGLTYETTVEPGLIDKIMHRINPHNKNETVHIYRNSLLMPPIHNR